jgi:hypothetical protein
MDESKGRESHAQEVASMPCASIILWRRWLLAIFASSAILLIVVCFAALRWLGSIDAAQAFLRGDELAVIPSSVDLGECAAGEAKEIQVQVVNLSSSPITLTGAYTSCSCIAVSTLPATIAARGKYSLQMTVHSTESSGQFRRKAVLYSDSKATPQMLIELAGRTVARDRPGADSVSTNAFAHEPDLATLNVK